jgi:hypothetical protein
LPLTDRQETLEHELKVAQMQADIELKQAQSRKSQQDLRFEPVRLVISGFLAGAATMAAAVGLATFLMNRVH